MSVAGTADDGADMSTTRPPLVDRQLGLRLLAVTVVATAGAAVVGVLVGLATYAIVVGAESESDGWAELGGIVFGAILGLGASVLGYVVLTAAGVYRVQPAGERWRPIVALLALPVGLSLPGAAASAVVDRYAPEPLAAAGSLLLFVAVVIAIGVVATVVTPQAALRVVAPLAVLSVVLFVVTAMVGSAAERQDTRAAIQRIGTLPLIDGERLDEPFPGWELDAVRHREYDDSIDVHWTAGGEYDGDAHMEITSTNIEVRVHAAGAGKGWNELEDQLRSRLVDVSADRFIEACGRRC